MHVIRSTDRPPVIREHPLPTLQRLVDRSAGSQSMTVLVNVLAPEERVPPHQHDVEEVLLITAGSCNVHVNGATTIVNAGDAVIVPPHTTHGFSHHGSSRTTVLAVLASADTLINTTPRTRNNEP